MGTDTDTTTTSITVTCNGCNDNNNDNGDDDNNNNYTPSRPRRKIYTTTTTSSMCSICIDDFEEGEKLRLFPNCGHAFHTDCILPWLTQRQGCCPYCKTPVALVSEEE